MIVNEGSIKQDEPIIINTLKREGFSDKEIKQIIDALKKAYNESIHTNESINSTTLSFHEFIKSNLSKI